MTCGAAFKFDAQTENAIRGLWQAINDAGLPSELLKLKYPPHLSLMLCEDINMDGVRRVLPDYIAHYPPFPLAFPALGVFPGEVGVIYLAPYVSRELLDFHAGLWELLERFTTLPSPLYRPGVWVPHVTLDLDVSREQTGVIVEMLSHLDSLPRVGLANALFVADFPGDDTGVHELFVSEMGNC